LLILKNSWYNRNIKGPIGAFDIASTRCQLPRRLLRSIARKGPIGAFDIASVSWYLCALLILRDSWYNRAGVERVMGFCTDEEYKEFLRSCPEFERMIVRSGIILLKYWISVSAEEQEKRFKERLRRPEKRWKLSDMDLQVRHHPDLEPCTYYRL